jgi:hypothetical protein
MVIYSLRYVGNDDDNNNGISALKSGPVRLFHYIWENRDRDRSTTKGNCQKTELKLIKTAKNRS